MADAASSISGTQPANLATPDVGILGNKRAETSGARSASRKAAAKISKRSKKIQKPSKAAQRDEARLQKAVDKEVARTLASSESIVVYSASGF